MTAAAAAVFCTRRKFMKTFVTIALVLITSTALAGEGGTGLQSPEPSTIGLFGAAVLFGVPAWYYRRRRKQQAEAQDAAE